MKNVLFRNLEIGARVLFAERMEGGERERFANGVSVTQGGGEQYHG